MGGGSWGSCSVTGALIARQLYRSAPRRYSRRVVEPLVLRGGVAGTLFVIALAAWVLGELATIARNRRYAEGGRDPTYLVMVAGWAGGIAGSIVLANNVTSASITGGRTWPAALGLAILVAGLAFRWWSIVTLGRYFTHSLSIQEGQQVVEDGPYAMLRHPSYTGQMIAFVGLGVALDNWLALAVAVLLPLVAVLVRIRAEEASLRQELGDAYRSYSARTRRLVPRVW